MKNGSRVKLAVLSLGLAAPIALIGPTSVHASTARPNSTFSVPCINFNNGAHCQVTLIGSNGEARVTNNPNISWTFHLACSAFGDQNSGLNPPGNQTSDLGCNLGAQAQQNGTFVIAGR